MGFMAGIETGGIHDLNWNRFVSRFELELMGFKAGNDRNNGKNTACIYIKHATYRCRPCYVVFLLAHDRVSILCFADW